MTATIIFGFLKKLITTVVSETVPKMAHSLPSLVNAVKDNPKSLIATALATTLALLGSYGITISAEWQNQLSAMFALIAYFYALGGKRE